jgi:ATP-dependent DNA helicase RecG
VYDSPEELLRKIRLGEDSELELKSIQLSGNRLVAPKPDELADVIAGMANTGDAALVLGVDDKTRDILGIPRDQLDATERVLFEICNDKIRPPVSFRTYRVELSDNTGVLQPVLKVEIPRSLFVHKSPRGYCHRQGSSTREMLPEVLARLFQQRSQARLIRFDEQAVLQTTFTDLEDTLWKRFIGSTAADPRTTLGKLSILTKDDTGIERATVTGVLLCSYTPEKWLPGAFVQAVHYRGTKHVNRRTR